MSLTVRWLYTLEDPLVRLVNDGGLTRNTVSCSVHYVDVGMWASFSKSLAVLLRRTLWPVVEPGNAYSLTHHTDKSLVFFSNEVWVNKTIVECRLYRKLIVESLIQASNQSSLIIWGEQKVVRTQVDCFIASKRTSARGFDGTTPPNQLCASADCRRVREKETR
ncbi:hypothetical protein Pcac1_g9279 [Phytophthora cactorum]|nr:hypothetical protein Pcac1_g9279 [Phytophthora cactorum]